MSAEASTPPASPAATSEPAVESEDVSALSGDASEPDLQQQRPGEAPPPQPVLEVPAPIDPELGLRVAGSVPAAGFSFLVGCVAVAGVLVVAGIGTIALTTRASENRGEERAARAIESMRTLRQAQIKFREQDLDQDGVKDFGTLAELGMAGLIDADLASGIKDGYRFEVGPSQVSPDRDYMAVANPFAMGRNERSYVANQKGTLYVFFNQHLELDLEGCAIPPGGTRVPANSPRR